MNKFWYAKVVAMLKIFVIATTMSGMTFCYTRVPVYQEENRVIESRKVPWSYPSEVDPRIVKHVIRHWDDNRMLNRWEEQRIAVALSKGLSKHGYTRWFFKDKWIEIFIPRENPDRLISRVAGKNVNGEEINLNLIEYR